MQTKITLLAVILLGLLSAGCSVQGANGTSFGVTVDRSDATIVASDEPDAMVVAVHSESGIGRAAFVRLAGPIPKRLTFELFLSGMEELRLEYGETTLLVSVQGGADGEIRQTASTREGAGTAEEIDPESPFWMEVEHVSACDTAGGPPTACFRIEAPLDMHLQQPVPFTLSWIDFYR